MKASAAAWTCGLALVLAACDNELLTAPRDAATEPLPADARATSAGVPTSGSANSNARPLCIVDDGMLLRIALEDAEAGLASLEVIKGAAAATLYGSHGCPAIRVVTTARAPRAAR